jgi:diguanylate cyclase (GGDEF)-like protein/PAS domain S-box-containing protein
MAVPAASVVLIEDSIPYARLVELILADAVPGGVEVRTHGTLAAGLSDLRERDADCVLLDLSLPDAQGLEALAGVLDASGGVPVVVLSGHDDEELARAAIRCGAQDYLVKGQEQPPDRFVRAIRFAVERRRAQERSEDLLRAKEDRWRTLTHLAPVGIVETDGSGRSVFANDWVSELTGRPHAELFGLGWRDAMDTEDRPAFDAAWERASTAGGPGEFALEARFVAPDGTVRWAHVTAVLLRDPWDGPAGWLITLVDVTPARRAREALAVVEQELRRQQEDVLALAALARDASVAEEPVVPLCVGGRRVVGADFVMVLVGDGADRLQVAAADGAEEPVPGEIVLGAGPSVAAQCFARCERIEVADAETDPAISPAFRTATGARTVVFEPLRRGAAVLGVLAVGWRDGAAGDAGAVPLSARRSTVVSLLAAEVGTALERRRLLDQLRDLARTDPLTGLANRRLWAERLDVELRRAARYGRPLCVAAVDLDRFKPYNDRFGHQAGDALLQDVAAAWRSVLRGSDLLSRLGGDEFAVLLPDCDVGCAQGILARVQSGTPGDAEGVGLSAGLVVWDGVEDAAGIMARADDALYAAKGAGRGQISLG